VFVDCEGKKRSRLRMLKSSFIKLFTVEYD